MNENGIAKIAVDVAYYLHSALGPDLLGSVKQKLYVTKLREQGLAVVTEFQT